MPSIFISYGREDTGGHAGRLSDRLIERFGKGQIVRLIGTVPTERDADRAEDVARSVAGVENVTSELKETR